MLALNGVFLIGVMAVFWIVNIVRQRSIAAITDSFGLGDLFMILAIGVCFPFVQLMIFLIGGLFFSICVHTFWDQKSGIPLAGYLSIFLGVIYLGAWMYDELILYT